MQTPQRHQAGPTAAGSRVQSVRRATNAAPAIEAMLALQRSAGNQAVLQRDDETTEQTQSGPPQLDPADVTRGYAMLGDEKVHATTQEELEEANAIIASMRDVHGITLSSATTIEGIKAQYDKVPDVEKDKLTAGIWEMKELRALHAATKHFATILGGARASSSMAGKAQGVTSVGRVKNAIDVNSATGKLDTTTMGESFPGKGTIGLFDTVTDMKDSRYIREGNLLKDNETTLEANAIHEMTHGLIEPTEGANWIAAMAFWKDKYTPSGTKGAEAPPTPYGKTGGAGEDLCESVAIYFTNRPSLKERCPEREAFITRMVAAWTPAKATEAVDAAAAAPGSGP